MGVAGVCLRLLAAVEVRGGEAGVDEEGVGGDCETLVARGPEGGGLGAAASPVPTGPSAPRGGGAAEAVLLGDSGHGVEHRGAAGGADH